jgi:hypothetical protein
MDVTAYHPQTQEFVHLESSTDASSWEKRRLRFERKFRDAAKHYQSLFPFHKEQITKIALVGFSRPRTEVTFGHGIKVTSVPDYVKQICDGLRKKDPMKEAVPEGLPLLRAMQFAVWYGKP